MKLKYFSDIDTDLIEFVSRLISETRKISNNIYVDLNENRNVVIITAG